jgi:hypothetical protein
VKDQIHIRNADAVQLARMLARQTGRAISETVLDALRQYRPTSRRISSPEELDLWRRLLRDDRSAIKQPETPVETLYDDATGLPV